LNNTYTVGKGHVNDARIGSFRRKLKEKRKKIERKSNREGRKEDRIKKGRMFLYSSTPATREFISLTEDIASTGITLVHCKFLLRDSWICFDQTLLGLGKSFPARESLVSDITTGDGNTTNLFYSVALSVLYAI